MAGALRERRFIGSLIWRTDTWEPVGRITELSDWYLYAPLAFSPADARLAVSGERDEVVHIWDLTSLKDARVLGLPRTTHYKNAKVALLGDSGVGKSGLGLVLSGDEFMPTESTHGRRVWVLDSSKVDVRRKHEVRELLLWDLAGQPGYRLVHQLHLEDVSLALILFDARNESDPFSGIRHWHRALQQARRNRPETSNEILVAARGDRGPVGVSQDRINALLAELGITAYVETSAKEGQGVSRLGELIRTSIDWSSCLGPA